MASPTYKDVCTGRTGHAEVVQVTCDPSEVIYDKLLDVFWENHDPTTLNRHYHQRYLERRGLATCHV